MEESTEETLVRNLAVAAAVAMATARSQVE
jgi:hypothetical protein